MFCRKYDALAFLLFRNVAVGMNYIKDDIPDETKKITRRILRSNMFLELIDQLDI